MRDDRLTVFLTPGELFCIAGSLGLANLPLVGSHYRGYSAEQIRNDINEGREMLETRGLLKQKGPREWEVDTSLSNPIQFIANPEYCLVLTTWNKNGQNQQYFLYAHDQQGLSVTYKSRLFNLVLYKDVKMMVKVVLNWLEIWQQGSLNQSTIRLPQIDLKNLLQKIWEKWEHGSELLVNAGVNEYEAEQIAQELKKTNSGSSLTLIYPEGERFSRRGQLFFINSSMNLWLNEMIVPTPGDLIFEPINAKDATKLVNSYIRGQKGEEASLMDEVDEDN